MIKMMIKALKIWHLFNLIVTWYTLDNGKMVIVMVKENNYEKTVLYMRDIGKMILQMEKED